MSTSVSAAFMASRVILVAAALLTAQRSVLREVMNLSALYVSVPLAAALCLPATTQLLLGVSWDALCVWCAWIEYDSWCTEVRSRRSRRDSDCPSANIPPRVGERQQSEWLKHEATSMWTLAAREVKTRLLLTQAVFRGFNAPPPSPSPHPPLSTLLRRSSSLCPAHLPVAQEKNRASPTSCPLGEALSPLHAVSLDMNHLYLSWTQFFWGRVFVTYAFYFTSLFGGAESIGLLRLCAYRLGRRMGFDPRGLRRSRDPRQVFAEFLLETSCAAAVHAVVRLDDGSVEGHFCFETAACVGEDDRLRLGRFEGEVCLKTRMLLRATFDGDPLLPEDAFCILSAEGTAHFHPQIHAYANWGTDLQSTSAYIHRLGIVTTIYNDMGYRGGPMAVAALKRANILVTFLGGRVFGELLDRLRSGMPSHKNIGNLMPYSDYVAFIVKVRRFFLHEFTRHRAEDPETFDGINGEALFIGTVLHSTDHSQFAHTHSVGDYVSIDKTRTAALAEAGQLILAGLSGKLRITPHLFGLSFSRSPHPLFSDTYKFAASINRRMADNMECCIVR